MGLREALPGKCRGVEVPWRGCALAVEKLKWLQRVAAVWVEALSKRDVMILGSRVGCFYVEAVVLIRLVASGSGSSGGHDLRAN